MKKQYKTLVNIFYFLIVIPFPNSLFGLSSNALTLGYLVFLILLMLVFKGKQMYSVKIPKELIFIYLLVFSILFYNASSQFALTFYLRILFAIVAGWFLVFWNAFFEEEELISIFRKILYAIGGLSFIIYVLRPPEDGRMISLFDVHTSKYFFFAFVVVFTHQVLKYNRTSDYIGLCVAFLMLSLSLQRGILLTAMFFLLLAFRDKVFKGLTWIVLLLIVCFQIGIFDPLLNRLFYETPAIGNLNDMMSNINSSGRLEFWAYLWLNENISIAGNGLGYSVEIGKAMFEGLNLVHNDFLWLLIDAGIWGIAVLILVFYYIIKKISKVQDNTLKRVYYALIFSVPIVMYVDNFVFHLYIYFPLLFSYFEYFRKKAST